MRIHLFFFLLLIVQACNNQPAPEQIETLEMAEREAIVNNMDIYGQIAQGVADLGSPDLALIVLENAQKVLDIRKEYGLDTPLEENVQNFTSENVKAYLEEINTILPLNPDSRGRRSKTVKNQIDEFENRNKKLLEQENPLTPHYVLLNLLYLEGLVLNELAREVGHH